MALPDFTSKEGKCWNPECEHTLSWGTRGNGKPNGWADNCPYCGWTAEGPPTNPKWQKTRWPEQYAVRIAHEWMEKDRVCGIMGRYWRYIKCEHDWVKTDAKWFEELDKNPTGHWHVYPPKVKCTGVICDKCGDRDVLREKNNYVSVGGGWNTRPREYFCAKDGIETIEYEWANWPITDKNNRRK